MPKKLPKNKNTWVSLAREFVKEWPEVLDGMSFTHMPVKYLKHVNIILKNNLIINYNEKKDGSLGSKKEFYNYPDYYQSCLLKFCCKADMLITGHYYAPNSPVLLSQQDLQNQLFNIKVIGDISCDINGPIASTIRPSTIDEPIYGYNCISGLEDNYMKNNVLVVMAVDNLPCSLPKDASIDFGQVFINQVLNF